MKTHELANKLLAMPDKEAFMAFFGNSIPVETVAEFEHDICMFSSMREDYGLMLVKKECVRIIVDLDKLQHSGKDHP